MSKLLSFAILLSSLNAGATCLALFNERGMTKDSITLAVDCYRAEAAKSTLALEKADALNHLSYLHFFAASFGKVQSADANLELSMNYAKQAAAGFGTWLDEAHYKTLGSSERHQVSKSLYFYGTSLARASERKGTITVVTKWPEIQKVMKMVMRLGHPYVAGYGAHRTLAIANTRMPPIAGGDKRLAEQYFILAIQKTDLNGVSNYPTNNNMYADLLLRLSRKPEACAQLLKVSSMTDAEVIERDSGKYEAAKDRASAQATYSKECGK